MPTGHGVTGRSDRSRRLRGDWRQRKADKQAAREAVQPSPVESPKARPIRNLIENCRTLIPGYDPWSMADGYIFDEDKAKKAIRFFETQLVHVKGGKARTPFLLEPWQQAVIGNLFGWVDGDGFRRYRKVLLFVPRKNGKTPFAAGILLYGLFEDGEPGAEIYGAASEYKQASLVFAHAKGMVSANPDLNGRSQIFKGQSKAIMLLEDDSIYAVVSSDALSAHGWNTHIGVIDELHTQPDRELVDAFETSIAARRQPLLIYITTSDFDQESICNETHNYASTVRDNGGDQAKPGYDPTFLPVIFEATTDDDWRDEAIWKKANPNLEVSVSLEYLRSAYRKACEVPTFENTFKRLHLNIRTKSDEKFLDMEAWDKSGDGGRTVADLSGLDCYAGLDLSSRSDLSALALVFPHEDGHYDCLMEFWVPADNAKIRERKDKVPYITWSQQGWLNMTPGDRIDQGYIRERLNELASEYAIRELCIDRWDASKITTELQGDGFTVIEHGQGYRDMSAPTKELEALVMGGKFHHFGNPVLRWCANNTSVEIDAAGNMKPSKKKSTEKIDGTVAAIMALGRAMVPTPSLVSIYSKRTDVSL